MDRTGGILQRTGQTERAVAIMLEQMERHPLRRLRTHAGERSERSDETIEARQRFLRRTRWSFAIVHQVTGYAEGAPAARQKGSLKPGGIGMPAVRPPIFSCVVSSTRRTASFIAAATRSSSMSFSSPISDASIETRRTS